MAKIKQQKEAASLAAWHPLDNGEPELGTRVVLAVERPGIAAPGYTMGRWGQSNFPPGGKWWMEVPDAPAIAAKPLVPVPTEPSMVE